MYKWSDRGILSYKLVYNLRTGRTSNLLYSLLQNIFNMLQINHPNHCYKYIDSGTFLYFLWRFHACGWLKTSLSKSYTFGNIEE